MENGSCTKVFSVAKVTESRFLVLRELLCGKISKYFD